MKRAALRWIRRLLVLGACAGVLVAVAHSPWARGLVRGRLTSALSASTGLDVSADSLDYNLFRLTASVEGLRISRRGAAAPILSARHVSAALSGRLLTGAVELDRLEADGVALVLDLAPPPDAPGAAAEPFRVPVFAVGSALLRHASIEILDPGGLGRLEVKDVTLEFDGSGPRRLEGTVLVAGGLTLDNEDTRARIDRVEGRVFLDGDTIGVTPVSALAGSQRLALDGSIVFTGPSPRFDLGIDGSVDVAQVTSWFPALPAGSGLLQVTGRVTGPLDDPQFRYSARTTGVTLPDVRLPAVTAEGYIARAGIHVERMRAGLGRGWVEVSGRLPLGQGDPDSRFSLTWHNVAVASLARVFLLLPADPVGMVATGTARLRWPGASIEFATIDGSLDSEVRVAPALRAAHVGLEASAGTWVLRAVQQVDGDSSADLETRITVDPDDLTRSRLLGTLRVSSSDLQQALVDVRHAFPGMPDASAWFSPSSLAVESTVDGTLSAPRIGGTARSGRLRVASLPAMTASADFEATPSQFVVSKLSADDGTGNRVDGHASIDFDAGTTNGGLRAEVTRPQPLLTSLLGTRDAAGGGLKAGGTAVLAAEWSGSIADPAVSATVSAADFFASSPSFSIERAAADGRLDGPLSEPEATVLVTAGALRASSLEGAPAEARFTLKAGRVDVNARVPDWAASFDGHVSAAAPHAFAANLTIADLAAARLATLLGGQDAGWTAHGAVTAKLDASGTLDDRVLKVGGLASVADGGIDLEGTGLVGSLNASLEIRGGRLWLTGVEGLGFNGPLSASGEMPLNWFGDYLPAGWRLDDAPEVPAPAAFTVRAEPDMKTLGTWLRPDEPGQITGTLRLRAAGTASAPSITAVDGRLLVEPDTVRVRDVAFTLPAASEIRVKDGRASADAFTITAPGTTASVSGTMALDGDRAVDARLWASGALGFLSSVVPGRLAGEFRADVRAAGPIAEPGLTGSLSLDSAAWVWPEQRLAFRDWSGRAAVSAEAVTIDALHGYVNGGDASVSGEIRFKGGGRGVTLRVRDAFAEVVKGLRSQADADLTLASAGEGARLSGNVTVTSGAYREPITAMARLFSSTPEAGARPDSTASRLDAITLDVELKAASPLVIENSAGRLDLVPTMKLQGTLAEPALFGSLDMVDEGRLTLLGRTFRLSEASVTFAGTSDPSVRLIGETRVADYDVTLRTNGLASRLEPSFTSEPPLSQRDVQSLLVTGRTTDIAGTKGRSGEEDAVGAASSDLLGFAGQMVGLETVQLGRADFELGSTDVNPAMRLTISKGISARSRLVLSQDLDNNKLTWIVIFTPRPGYEVRVSARDNVEDVVEFRQELFFGPGVSPPRSTGFRKRTKGPRVSSLRFTGELSYPVSELESAVKLKPSKRFDPGTWQDDRARLEKFYRDRGYATARIEPGRTVEKDGSSERVRLEYRVDPGPRTVLTVAGLDLSASERRHLMRVWSGSVLPEFLDDDLEAQLRAWLAERGHLRPSISIAVDSSDEHATFAKVVVDPGPATTARRLVIEGTRGIPEADLQKAISGSPALDQIWVDPAPLVEIVQAVYAARGYPSARVSADALRFEGEAAERRLRVAEGPQAIVGDIVVAGVADARAGGVRSAIGLPVGTPLLPGMEVDARRRVERFYLDHGFRSAAVRSTSKRGADGRVALSFAVTEGPVAIIDAVQVSGIEATRPSVADGAVALKPGLPAGQQGVEETQTRLYGLGVFRRADITFEPVSLPEAPGAASVPVNMLVSLEEARRFQVRYGVQVSNQYGPVFDDFTSAIGVAADIRDRNFLGRAFTLGASGRLEKNLQSTRAQFSLPPMFSRRLQTSFYGTFRSETDKTAESVTYTDKERDATFEQRLRLPFRMDVSWGYSFNTRDVSLSVQRSNESVELKNALGYVTGTFVVDHRDSPFNASRGWFQSSNLQWGLQALGSDFDYFRILLRQFYYRPAGPFVFASGVRWGWLHGLSGVPDIQALGLVDQLFDAGGAQTVRGYAEDSLSAYEIFGAPVGGSKLLLLNQEVRFPLFSRWLQGAAFIDAGNTFKPGTPLTLDQLAVGVGFGIRIMTPFAPLRLDLGYPINRRPDDKPYRFYFAIGQVF